VRNEILKSVFFILLVAAFVLAMNAYRGVPNPVVIVLVLFILFNYLTNKTVFAAASTRSAATRWPHASRASTSSGSLVVFAINGVMAAIAGIFLTSRLTRRP